ncbi:MAG: DUF1007 family protein [Deltaproteobacteria bacterium]|nr:DUF1007 family protein [Deltaproteobacteria bacterium]
MKKKLCWFVILYLVLSLDYVFAHPHVFIDNTVTIVFDHSGLTGIRVKWGFDEMFSSMIIHDYDTNKDSTFSHDEIEKIKNGAFSNLKSYNYFTYLKINGEEFIVKYVKDFSADLNSNKVVYNFFIPCHVSATSSYKEIKLSMYDSTYYTDIMLANQNPVSFVNTSLIEYRYEIQDNTKKAFYYGQVFPQEIILTFKKKK